MVKYIIPSASKYKCQSFAESGFGGWIGEKVGTVLEAGSFVEPGKVPSTTFDNTSRTNQYYKPGKYEKDKIPICTKPPRNWVIVR